MQFALFPSDEEYLDPREVACRLVKSFPITLIDWARGNQIIEEERRRLVALNVTDVFLVSHQTLVDNTAYVQLSLPEYPTGHVSFVLRPRQSLVVSTNDPLNERLLKSVALRLAEVLGYELKPCGTEKTI